MLSFFHRTTIRNSFHELIPLERELGKITPRKTRGIFIEESFKLGYCCKDFLMTPRHYV